MILPGRRRRGAGPGSGSNRVNRGGSWNNNARNCRSANRNRNDPGNRNNNLGLRLASTVKDSEGPIRDDRCLGRRERTGPPRRGR